jgi:hypothetical protein
MNLTIILNLLKDHPELLGQLIPLIGPITELANTINEILDKIKAIVES